MTETGALRSNRKKGKRHNTYIVSQAWRFSVTEQTHSL